jgi:beta-galactosidase
MIDGWTTSTTDIPFAQVIDRIGNVATAMGLTIFAMIDHARNAREAGLDLKPETVIFLGNANTGTSLMVATPEIGYELPLRILVWQRNGPVQIGYRAPVSVATEYGADDQSRVAAMGRSIATLVERAIGSGRSESQPSR